MQVTDVDGTMYVAKGITCGVPHGPILEPLLFLINDNDMFAAVKCKVLLYADDPDLFGKGKYIAGTEATSITELESVIDWLLNNTSYLSIWVTRT